MINLFLGFCMACFSSLNLESGKLVLEQDDVINIDSKTLVLSNEGIKKINSVKLKNIKCIQINSCDIEIYLYDYSTSYFPQKIVTLINYKNKTPSELNLRLGHLNEDNYSTSIDKINNCKW